MRPPDDPTAATAAPPAPVEPTPSTLDFRILVANPSPFQRTNQWATCTIPAGRFDPGTPLKLRYGTQGQAKALGGPLLSDHLQLVHILAPKINPFGNVNGRLLMAAEDEVPEEYVVPKELAEPMPIEMEIIDGDGNTFSVDLGGKDYQVVANDRARMVEFRRRRVEGTDLTAELWLYYYSGQLIVPFELLITSSNPETTRMDYHVQSIDLRCPHFFEVRGLTRRGGESLGDKIRLVRETSFGDAQSLAWYGSVLVEPHPTTDKAEEPAIYTTLGAEKFAPLVAGCVVGWKGKWGPFGVTPRAPMPAETLHPYGQQLASKHFADMESAGDPWDSVPFGQAKRPAQTGDQQGFGVTKMGEYFGLMNPVWLMIAQYSAIHGLACRPIHMREADGSPISVHDHPDLVTWDERTHYHPRVSFDRLGKGEYPEKPDTHGWLGRDNQHHQPLFEIGYYALTGTYMVRQMLEEIGERLLSGLTLRPNWSTTGIEAARAVGRTCLSLAWLDWALGAPRLTTRAVDRIHQVVAEQWPGGKIEPGRTVKVLEAGWDPRLPHTSGWRPPFEALAVVGMLAIDRMRGCPKAREIAAQLLHTIAFHGIRERDGAPWVFWGVHYRLGDHGEEAGLPLDEKLYDDPSFADPGGGSWRIWTAAALKLGIQLADETGDGDLRDRCEWAWKGIDRVVKADKLPAPEAIRYAEWTAV